MLIQKLRNGFLSKDASIAAVILLGLLAWSMNHIADGVLGTASIELTREISQARGPDAGKRQLNLTIENLSRDTPVQNLLVSIEDPPGISLIAAAELPPCVFPEPQWADGASCTQLNGGVPIAIPWLLPGNEVRVHVVFAAVAPTATPIVRIKPGDQVATKIRVLAPGIESWLIRNQTEVLIGIVIFAGALYFVTIAAGLSKDT